MPRLLPASLLHLNNGSPPPLLTENLWPFFSYLSFVLATSFSAISLRCVYRRTIGEHGGDAGEEVIRPLGCRYIQTATSSPDYLTERQTGLSHPLSARLYLFYSSIPTCWKKSNPLASLIRRVIMQNQQMVTLHEFYQCSAISAKFSITAIGYDYWKIESSFSPKIFLKRKIARVKFSAGSSNIFLRSISFHFSESGP